MRRSDRGFPMLDMVEVVRVVRVDALLRRLYELLLLLLLLPRKQGAVATVLAVSVEALLRRFALRREAPLLAVL